MCIQLKSVQVSVHLLKAEGANAREISVGDAPIVHERHAQLLRSVNSHLTAGHQQRSFPRRARHLANESATTDFVSLRGYSTGIIIIISSSSSFKQQQLVRP